VIPRKLDSRRNAVDDRRPTPRPSQPIPVPRS
jgi:hypothetical protein